MPTLSTWLRTGRAALVAAGVFAVAAPAVAADSMLSGPILPSGGSGYASVSISSNQSSPRYVSLTVLGKQLVNIPKYSDPLILVQASGSSTNPTMTAQVNLPGGSCMAVDDPQNGTFNRSIMLDTSSSGAADLYVKMTGEETYADGSTKSVTVEPFAYPGMAMSKSQPGDPVDVADVCIG